MQTPRPRPNFYSRLQFADAAGCVAWLESLPLSDAAATHEIVSAQVEIVSRAEGLTAIERLRILEVLQRPIASLQQDFASRYAGKPLPLSIMDYAVWNSVIELWQTLFGTYHDLLNAASSGEPTLQRHAPLLALRCLESTGASMREHQRAYRAIPAGLWMQLHKVFARAEQSGFVGRSLDDPVGAAGATRSCTAAYAQAVLADRANPYALSARQMDFAYRWLALWGPLARVTPDMPPDAAATTLAVDLASRCGASAVAENAPATRTLRFLDLDQLSRSMRRTLALLQQGRSPAELGLGDDCRQPGTEGLVSLLHTTWFGGGLSDFPPRTSPGEPVQACVGFRAAHHQLSAGDSEPQDETDDQFATRTAPWNPTVEKWVVHDSGVNGMVRVVRNPECELRVQHRQLVGMRRNEHAPLQVGILQRLELAETGDLAMSVRVIPAAAQGVELRRIGPGVAATSKLRAILLAGTQVPAAAPTLLLEPGHFYAGMSVEIVGAQPGTVTLTQVVEQGVDFERVAFAA